MYSTTKTTTATTLSRLQNNVTLTTEISKDLCPIWRIGIAAQIRFQFGGEDFQCGRFAGTVLTDQTEHFTRTRNGQTMQFERILGVTMCGLLLQVAWNVDDGDGIEWAFLYSIETRPF